MHRERRRGTFVSVQTSTVEDVLARIEVEVARAGREAVLAFDGDGTLWSGDIGEDFFDAVVERGDFRAECVDQLRADAGEFEVDADGDGVALARRLYDAYRDGRYPEERTCEMMTWACAGWRRSEVEAFAREVVEARALAERLHGEVVRVVEWARAADVPFFLVSASPREVVEAGAALVGVPRDRVIAATAMYEPSPKGAAHDVMRAAVVRPIPYGAGKVHGLEARLGGRVLVAAFGDNAFDVAMLATAKVPVAIRPKDRLRARAAEVVGLTELVPIGPTVTQTSRR